MTVQYGFVPALEWHQQGLTLAQIGALAVMACRADSDGACFPAQTKTAETLGISRAWLNRTIKMACEIGNKAVALSKSHRHREDGGMRSCNYIFPRPARSSLSSPEHSPLSSPEHSKEQNHNDQESPLTPQGKEERDFCHDGFRKRKGGRLNQVSIAAALEQAALRVRALQDRQQPTGENALVECRAALPACCPEEERDVGWIVSVCRDRASIQDWPTDVRRTLLNQPELVEVALQRRERAMQGADPDTIARMLAVFQSRVPPPQDAAVLEADLTADIATLAKGLPTDLLPRAYDRINSKWKAGFRRRPAAGDFLAAVENELRERRDEIRWLKTGLDRIYGERIRQDRKRAASCPNFFSSGVNSGQRSSA